MFSSDNGLCVGDHVSWHTALDKGDSSIQHMLLTFDPQLKAVKTPLGNVNFIQVRERKREEGGEREREREKEREWERGRCVRERDYSIFPRRLLE